MNKKIVFGVAAVALAVLVIAPSASASCIPAKNASTYGQALSYWTSPSATNGTLTGQTWQLGAPGTWSGSGGTVPCAGFLYFSGGGVNLNLDLGSCGAGCPAHGSTLAVLAQNVTPTGTEFLLDTVVENDQNPVFFDYSVQGSHSMIPLPRPRVISSSRAGGSVNLSIQIPSITGGLYGPGAAGAVSGYNIMSASSATNPGRDASAYSLRSSIPSPNGNAAVGTLSVDCSNIANDQWVVTQIQFENGTVLSSAVSDATQVKCNPALADPRYKIVPKKGVPKNINPNNNPNIN